MLKVSQIKIKPKKHMKLSQELSAIKSKVIKLLRISDRDIQEIKILKKSIDARKKDELFLTYSVAVSVDNESRVLKKVRNNKVAVYEEKIFNPIKKGFVLPEEKKESVLIAGFGPAGIFAGYVLALNGYKPVIIERGKAIDKRDKDVETFLKTGILEADSNVQFGEGGAGTYSDGKLYTQVKDSSGQLRFILDTFVKYGANENILYEQHAHIGTDVLKKVIINLREEIIRLGGKVIFEECLSGFEVLDKSLNAVMTNSGNCYKTTRLILAIGHSARDTFEAIAESKLDLEPKAFAVGYRVIHQQKKINIAQYGEEDYELFEAAPYKLTAKTQKGRGVFSFCMCPGGYVINASSEMDGRCVNGMSYSGRDGSFANSAIVVTVDAQDYLNYLNKNGIKVKDNDPLLGMHFQRLLERKCYEAGKGKIPVQYFSDYKNNSSTTGRLELHEAVMGQIEPGSVRNILPEELEDAFLEGMEHFGRVINGFDAEDTILAGVESRTSSPIRILRDAKLQSNIRGIYPCGEGAGYAGGIMSAANDGIRVALKIIEEDCKEEV